MSDAGRGGASAGRSVDGDSSATPDEAVVLFTPPVPLCRVPVTRPQDGRVVLDFPSEAARAAFRQRCKATVAANAQAGARAACSLQAMDTCRGPRWLRWLGWRTRKPWSEVEACEAEEMEKCVAASQAACHSHAQQFCEVICRPPP